MSSESRTHGTGGETARAAEECSEAGERAAVRQVTVCASAGLLGGAGLLLAVLTNCLPGLAERFALASFWLWEIAAALKLLQMFSHHAPHTSSV